MTNLDDLPALAGEAELIFLVSKIGVPLHAADSMELWELAAAGGLHRVETFTQRDEREIIAKKEEYWDETQAKRRAIMERRKQRKAEAKRGKKVT